MINMKILQPSIKLHVVPLGNIDAHGLEAIIAPTHTYILRLSDYHISFMKQQFFVSHLYAVLQETEKNLTDHQ